MMPAYSISNGMRKATNPQAAFQHALATVLPITVAMILVSWSGFFSTATVELGLEHYAEKCPSWLPQWIPMPLNTVINFGYILCGLHWCLFIGEANRSGIVKSNDAYLFFVFNTMGCVYSTVQLYRIIFQTRSSAIMDQWYTLPFFMLVYVWSQSFRGKCSKEEFYAFMLMSVGSYQLTLFTTVGFEIILGCHIFLAMLGGVRLYWQCPSEDAQQYFALAILNCTGFVVLKLLDHHLPGVHWIFSYVSGHFLSKICDVLQLHYVNEFFFAMALNKAVDPVAMKRFKSC